MLEPAVPLVFVGSINGDIEKAISKLVKVRRSMSVPEREPTIFVCGDFFGNVPPTCRDYLIGSKKVPVPMYILGPTCPEQGEVYSSLPTEMVEIMPNVTYIGKFGVLVLPEGVIVAYLGGVERPDSTICSFNEKDVAELVRRCARFPHIDVLVTYQWPKGIERCDPGSNITVASTSKLISQLVATIKPRLHVAANEQTSFTSPFMVHGNDVNVTTIFHGLTSFEKYKEGKWVYGINLPLVGQAVPPNQTVPLPFSEFPEKCQNSYFFDSAPSTSKRKVKGAVNKRRSLEVIVPQQTCWFCMSNSDIDRSLFVAVSQHAYMTLAKGPLVDGHVTILPIRHIEKMAEAPGGVELNIHQFLNSLSQYYSSKGQQLIWFERCFKAPHMMIDALPVDPALLTQGILHKIIEDLSKQKGLEVNVLNLQSVANLRKNISSKYYFYLQIGSDKGYLINITKETDFPINFGRMILAELMGTPERVFWKNCVQDSQTVSRTVSKFRAEFEPYNFTLKE